MKCRLINSSPNTPSMNMAIDEVLLDSELPVLRFYQWIPPGLSIGYDQSAINIDKEFCLEKGIQIVRRPTGGNAVLHDKELTYSFIISQDRMPKSVIESYKEISKGIVKAFEILGLQPELNDEVHKVEKSPVCFHDPSWYEILVNGKKIVGSAQKRTKGKVLQHGAVLIDMDIEKYAGCFKGLSDKQKEALKSRITSINDEGKKVDYAQVAEAMKQGFQKALKLQFIPSILTQEELKKAKELSREKYSSLSWNE
ncbi:lipoate--protein ligase family protein [Candidatus Woesearchaeota archaeon]|nr:lipoate--protein ligase family protein [Candidatus Woesearchaeota archaeon]